VSKEANISERVLILTPTGHDAANARAVLEEGGLGGVICEDCPDLQRRITEGAGALLIAEEALTPDTIDCLLQALAAQPPWSDVPLLLITSATETEEEGQALLNTFAPHGKITLIERPVRPVSLVSALRSALRGRRRQYQMRDILEEQQRILANIQANERRFRAVFNQQFQFMAILSPEGVVLEVNELPLRATGVAREQVEGKVFWETPFWAHLPEMRESWPKRLAQAARSSEPVLSVDTFMTAEGAIRMADAAVTAVRNSAGEVEMFIIQATDITERRAAEERVRESEERFRVLFEALPVGAFLIEPGTERIVDCNSRAAEALGYSRAELCALSVRDIDAQLPADEIARMNRNVVQHGAHLLFETRHRTRSGELRDVLITAAPIQMGGKTWNYASALDITERKRAEAALRKSEELTRTITDNSTQAVFMMNEQGYCTFMNPAAEKIFGFTFEEITARPLHEMIHHHHRDGRPYPMQECPIDRALPENFDVREHEDWFIRSNGEFFPVLVAASPIFDQHGKPISTVIEVRDVTERKRAEEALREREAVLRTVTNEARVGLVMVNQERRYVFANQTYADILGLPDADIVGRRVAEVLGAVYDQIGPRLDRAFAGERVQYELRVPVHPTSGGEHFYDVVYEPRVERVAEPYVVVVIVDITERKRAEEELRKSEERYRSLVAVVTDVPWTTDAEGAFVTPQTAWANYTGQAWDEYRGFGWANALHPDDRAEVQRVWKESLRTRSNYHVQTRMFHAQSGDYRHVVGRAVPLVNSDGTVREWVGSCTDVHEQRLAAQKLERTVAERTAQLRDTVQQLETFSYSIVHDMRAPLRSMRSFASFLQSDYGEKLDETGQGYLARIISSASRLDALITDVLSYSRVSMNEADLQRVDLGSLLKDLLEQYPQFQEAAAHIHVQPPLPVVLGNHALLTQVFSNLLGNALKFVRPGHEPSVTVRAESLNGSPRVRVWVEDKGIGIPAEYRQKLFGLFQRLHKPEEYAGTGVGLAIVKKAIERMGGAVGVESEPNQGSRFWIELARV
jgi:PAS domain S-box-containing protein